MIVSVAESGIFMSASEKKAEDALSELKKLAESLAGHKLPSSLLSGKLDNVKSLLSRINLQYSELVNQNMELASSCKKYSDLYEDFPGGYLLADDEDRIIEVNLAFAEFLGYGKAALMRRKFSGLLHPDERELYKDSFKSSVKKIKSGHMMIMRMLKADDSYFYAGLQVRPVAKNKTSSGGAYRISVADMTSCKLAEDTLRKQNEFYRELFWKNSAVKLIINPDSFEIIEANPEACEFYGYNEKRLRKLKFNNICRLSQAELKKKVSETRRGKKKVLALSQFTSKGEARHVELYLSTVMLNHREMLFCIVHDTTEFKVLEEQLNQYASKLRSVNEELTQYAHAVAHDMQSHLRAIHNYVDFLLEDLKGCLQEEHKTYLDGTAKAVKDAEAMVRNLLEISRLDTHEIVIEKIRMKSFIMDILSYFDLKENVNISIKGEWQDFESEPTLLKMIFKNLISNALKFNKSTVKIIELGCGKSEDGQKIEFYVKDNGIGIDPLYHERIFNIFERISPADEQYEGSGIGLAIVKKLANKLYGFVRVSSSPGKGSVFYVSFPIKFQFDKI
ncbi:MAG: hypothetical protein A2017_00790 [Lentisphaerae bacterium GWF2_44_16]|nr:MAG: hypothetical protein A2017_00790 [Lentisphaerae bacterium GWF2_44_16]